MNDVFSGKNMQVAMATDQNYADFAYIAVFSMLYWQKQTQKSQNTLHLMYDHLTAETLERFEKLLQDHGWLFNPILIEDAFFEEWPAMRWSKQTYYRLILPDMFPEMEKMIYVDCDILFLDDIRDLWDIPLNGHPVAAVPGTLAAEHRKTLGLQDGVPYFNAGVMVYNLKLMHQQDRTREFIRLFQEYAGRLKYPDQDILNVAFQKQCCYLPLRWNLYSSVYRNPPVPGVYTEAEGLAALTSPGIVHFTGAHKPWRFKKSNHHPYSYAFYQFVQKSGVSKALSHKLFWKFLLQRKIAKPKKNVPWKPSQIRRFKL